jgi:hypothetical protein
MGKEGRKKEETKERRGPKTKRDKAREHHPKEGTKKKR